MVVQTLLQPTRCRLDFSEFFRGCTHMIWVDSGKEASHRRAVGTYKTSIYKANEENELQLSLLLCNCV